MPRKKTVKIIEEEKLPENNNFILFDNNNLNILETYIQGIKFNLNNCNLQQLNDYSNIINSLNNKLNLLIQQLFNYSDNIIELKTLISDQVKKLEILNNQPTKNFKSLDELILNITNLEQVKRLNKILPDNQDYAKVYLQGYTNNIDEGKKNLIGTIKILGQYNFQKKERESYNIKILTNEENTFWCSCIDHKLNSVKKGTVCKHISFIVCKVMKVFNLDFFDSKKLSETKLEELIAKFSDKSDLWKNKDYVRDIKQLTIDTFKLFPEPIDDVCTFCYDQMNNDDKPKSVCCPSCKHCYHSECMDIWLENYLRCSICSSDIWKHYTSVKNGDTIVINNKL